MRRHFDRALALATEQGRPSGRCEVLARRALEEARLGAERGDDALLALAERSANEAKDLAGLFETHQPWGAEADAALAEVALARGDLPEAAAAGRRVAAAFQESMQEDIYPEMLLPAARAILAAGEEHEREEIRGFLQLLLMLTAQRTVDEDVRVRWFTGPIGSGWARLAGPVGAMPAGTGHSGMLSALGEDERRLLALLTEGLTTEQIAERVEEPVDGVRLRLQQVFAKVGASTRGEATAFALRAGVL
jgi:DNA-binding CsgD family transcriptional regulator